MIYHRPLLWVIFMGALSFMTFALGSFFDNSLNVVWPSVFIAFLLNVPPKKNKETKIAVEEVYNEWGIKHGTLKYRIGLFAYIFGAIAGWVVFYGKIVNQF
jgi:hypothetical protein